ncbi:HAD-IA family hydrolase [Rhodococcus sp. HM1]|uniref:HAD family hydrolase n=1 Tax=unclassified Rhodococcus (in: high G+C Gram-positive bacteria) TaxID=192944 RepID=UPI00200A5C3C|nr:MULTISPECIES: HAD-IA family hydrolase [unclassified Rhodococcus (in: high G+C Gram-positive bacteria)]MCK8672445.1 HAD-IA family hydrolase [Rhodococcus sp. HM1]
MTPAATPPPSGSTGFAGAIFDVDGVLVDSPHEAAWRRALHELMVGEWSGIRDATTWSPEAFTPQVYQRVLSGKPRLSGARAALEYFHVPDAAERTATYAERKQQLLVRLIDERAFEAYPDAVRFVLAVRAAGIPVAAASSSKNADRFLRGISLAEFEGVPDAASGFTLLDVFDANLSGRDFARGKPDPEIFLTAAGELGVLPESCFVVEDAVSGILAAKAGDMAALGVARSGDADALVAAHADLVVTSLDDVDRTRLLHGELATRSR